ncbi:MAG TPA: ATP-binding protein [Candidatus Acidoferrales bacterium]|nr:ATP-binding protein [Candidatus Acidoferrales bacterium]
MRLRTRPRRAAGRGIHDEGFNETFAKPGRNSQRHSNGALGPAIETYLWKGTFVLSFRFKLALVFTATLVMAVTLVTWGVTSNTRAKFELLDQSRSNALIDQFRKEFAQRGDEVVNRVSGIAETNETTKMAIDLSRPQGDASKYVYDADGLAPQQKLDFLDLVGDDGSLISSFEYKARFGYKTDWVTAPGVDWNNEGAFLQRIELPDGVALSLTAVHVVTVGDKKLYVIGGVQLGKGFLTTLVLPTGMRALFYKNLQPVFDPGSLADVNGPLPLADRLSSLIEQVRKTGAAAEETIQWNADPASAENFHADPLFGREKQLLGVLLVGSSRKELVSLLDFIRTLGVLVGGAGILLGGLIGLWVSARVSRPIARLATGARQVAAGDWGVRVDVRSRDEVGRLARDFNEMTRQLAEQRDRLVQAERVAAWREIARRLAHELKNPLFPLQLTLENLQRARTQTPEQFDEIFEESTATLRAELNNLKTIVARFSDFSKMPAPQLQSVNLNEAVRSSVRLYDAQFNLAGRPPISPELYLDESLPLIQADPDLLHRALGNLVLNSLDAMPSGGTLTIRTAKNNGTVAVEISDTGAGLTPEECERLFTPYYTTKRHGTGLGLAIVQSVVSDHHGKISVESAPGAGATFRIELPVRPPEAEAIHEITHESSGENGESGYTGVEAKKEETKPVAAPRRELASVTKSTLGLGN